VAVDQHRRAELPGGGIDQGGERTVEWLVKPFDALERNRQRQPGAINLLGIGDDARDRAEATGDANGPRVGESRERLVEQLGIEFVRFAVDVDIGAGKPRGDQGRAERGDAGEQLVDVAVLGLAERVGRQAGRCQETVGVDASGMRRAEHERNRLEPRHRERIGWRQMLLNGITLVFQHVPCQLAFRPRRSVRAAGPSHFLCANVRASLERCRLMTATNKIAKRCFPCPS
jgi:hypothetical protein